MPVLKSISKRFWERSKTVYRKYCLTKKAVTTMNVCIISGSARQDNNTFRVGKAIQRLHQNDQTELIDFKEYDIPLVAQSDRDQDLSNPFQQRLARAMKESQVIYIITPEYNWSITPEILNWLHRWGDKQYRGLFDQKVFALVGVSTGKGGKAPLLHLNGILNKIISYLDLDAFVSARIFEAHYVKEVLDEEGESKGNVEFDTGLKVFINYTRRMVQRWNH